jgi:hypothetical protein
LLSHINLINIMLAGVLIFFINYTLLPFLHKSIQYSLPVMAKHEEAVSGSDKKPDQAKTLSPLDFMVITEQNLFHPERKIPAEIKEAQPLPKPDFVLYGTLLSDDVNIAYMEDKKSPFSTPGRGVRPVPLQIGQTLGGFTLKEVETGKVVMARGEEKVTVYLDDPAHVKTRTSSAGVQQATVPVSKTKQAVLPEKEVPSTSVQPSYDRTNASQRTQPATDKNPATDKPKRRGPFGNSRIF